MGSAARLPAGIQQKVLSGALDEAAKRGCRTRLLRFAPGAFTTEPFVHDYWEEVFLVSGDLWVGNDAQGRGGERFGPMTYAASRRARGTARSARGRLPAPREPQLRPGLSGRCCRRTGTPATRRATAEGQVWA
jgi:hypothetical protein